MDVASYRLPVQFDAARLRADLAIADAWGWQQHFHQQDFSGDWCGVALRSASGRTDDLFAHPDLRQAYSVTPLLERCSYFREVLDHLGVTLRGVRLLGLGPGSLIRPHRDRGLAYRFGELRLHIPIITGDAVEFKLAGEVIAMRPGECWYLDFDQVHSVSTAGTDRRVHLVLDGLRDERSDHWLAASNMAPLGVADGTRNQALDERTRQLVVEELLRRNDEPSRTLAAALLASVQ